MEDHLGVLRHGRLEIELDARVLLVVQRSHMVIGPASIQR